MILTTKIVFFFCVPNICNQASLEEKAQGKGKCFTRKGKKAIIATPFCEGSPAALEKILQNFKEGSVVIIDDAHMCGNNQQVANEFVDVMHRASQTKIIIFSGLNVTFENEPFFINPAIEKKATFHIQIVAGQCSIGDCHHKSVVTYFKEAEQQKSKYCAENNDDRTEEQLYFPVCFFHYLKLTQTAATLESLGLNQKFYKVIQGGIVVPT